MVELLFVATADLALVKALVGRAEALALMLAVVFLVAAREFGGGFERAAAAVRAAIVPGSLADVDLATGLMFCLIVPLVMGLDERATGFAFDIAIRPKVKRLALSRAAKS